MSNLTSLQIQAFEKFKALKVGALFMEMGTGKTRVALELINYNIEKVDYILWLTPCSTKDNLRTEIDKWNYPFEVNIFGWETLSQSNVGYLNLLSEISDKKLFIVADESIFIKNSETVRFNRLLEISKDSEFRLILNGTPLTKDEWDIYNQMHFLSPKIIDMSPQMFQNVFYKRVTYKKRGEKERSFLALSEVNVDHLHKLIAPYVLKVDFIFDKKVNVDTIYTDPSPETELEYSEIKNSSLENMFCDEDFNLVALLQKLNYISSKDEDKAEEIIYFIKKQENKQIIVFCNYIKEVELLSSLIDCYVITGEVKQNERDSIIKDFENNNIPLIMTIGTGAYGLNMQFCNHIIFSSITFDFGKMEQAKARIKRIGQERDITITYFDIDLPINRIINDNLDKKEMLLELVIAHLKEDKECQKST